MSNETIIFDISPVVFAHTAIHKDGGATSALRFFIRMIRAGWWNRVGFALDSPRASLWRRKLYRPYKAHRKPTPPLFVSQLAMTRAVLKAAAIPTISTAGEEADDIIATMAGQCIDEDRSCLIVSPDSDLLALVTATAETTRWSRCGKCFKVKEKPPGHCPECKGVGLVHTGAQGTTPANVAVWNPRKKKLYLRFNVWDQFHVWPSEIQVYKAVCGDASDGVPGVPGWGKKKTTKLMNQCRVQGGPVTCMRAAHAFKKIFTLREYEAFAASMNLVGLNSQAIAVRKDLVFGQAVCAVENLLDWSRRMEEDKDL